MEEEDISLRDYKELFSYLIEFIKSYKNFNGLLTGFSLTSLIFLFSTSFGNISEDNFNNLMFIISWIVLAFMFFLTNTCIYYFIENSCYSINYNNDYNYIEKYNKLIRRENIIIFSHFIFLFGLAFLIFSIILILISFAKRAILVIMGIGFIFLIYIILLAIIFGLGKLINLIKERKKR